MPWRIERVRPLAEAVVREIRREDVTFMAASIAYHALVSMLPILVLLTFVLSAVGSERVIDTTLGLTAALLPATGQRILTDALRNATGSVGLSVISVGVLLWGISKIFRAMDAAFAEIFDTERKLTLLGQLRDTLVVVVALAIAAVGAVGLGTVLRVPATVPLAGLLNALIAVVGLAVVFLPLYAVFPNVDLSAREVLPGVVVAAVGWVGLKSLFSVYVSLSSKPDIYGLAGTFLLLVTWLYVGSLALLVGAAVNATLAGRTGDRSSRRAGKRRFGRRVTDVEGFEDRLDELIDRAVDAGVPAGEVRRAIRRRAAAGRVDRER